MSRNGADRKGSRIVGLLDIGTSKVAAAVLIADAATARGVRDVQPSRIAGLGLHRSRGVKAGVLTDLDEAEIAVRAALGQAERAAGVNLDSVIVSVASGRLSSQHFAASAPIDSGVVDDDDIDRVLNAGKAYAERDGRMLVHLNRLGFRIDGTAGVSEPRGLAAHKLTADLHAVTADEAPIRNLLLLIERCYLKCESLVVAPYASGLAVTSAEERALGVTCIDIGAGTASISLFADGQFVGAEVVPVGSQHMSFDIARALQTPLAEAERIKTLYGTLVSAQSDEHETITYPLAGEEEGATFQTTKAHVAAIIRPRFAQILNLARERLANNAASAYAGDKIVLTGGASQLLGAGEFAASEFGRPVRIGRPGPIAGLTGSVAGPHFATLAGMVAAVDAGDGAYAADREREQASRGYLGRVGSWLKQGF